MRISAANRSGSMLAGLLAIAMCLWLSACGGSGGAPAAADSGPTPPPATPNPPAADGTISGTAATGVPMDGALITVYDRSGTIVGTTTAAATGAFSLTIPAASKPPLVLEASRGGTTLVSVSAAISATVNVTPLTDLIAARLAPDGNPLTLQQAIQSGTVVVDAATLQARVQELRSLLKPVLDALGDNTDPLSGAFSADGTGHDRVLDSLRISIRPANGGSNIEVAVLAKPADASAPMPLTKFTSSTAVPAPLPAVSAAALVPPNVGPMIADLLARTTACFALPLSDRVQGATATSTNVTGTAADVKAAQCRGMFAAGDPATFLESGARVGRDSNNAGAFTALFRAGATGVAFQDGQLEFLQPNGDMVISYRTRNAAGVVSDVSTLTARPSGPSLGWIGNQYAYYAMVTPYIQDREFFNAPASSYQSTGYDVNVANALDAQGKPIFAKVVVTTPLGGTLTLLPDGARSALSIVKPDQSLGSTTVLRLAARFTGSRTGDPSTIDYGLVYASPLYTDAQIEAIPEQGAWTLEFFHQDTSVPNATQVYRTLARAPSLAEIAQVVFPVFTATFKAELTAASASKAKVVFGPESASAPNVVQVATAAGGDAWDLPAGAAPVTSVTAFGSAPNGGAAYDDAVGVAASARKATITCSPFGASDTHCSNGTGILQYAQGTTMNTLQLYARSPRMVGVSKMAALYLPRP